MELFKEKIKIKTPSIGDVSPFILFKVYLINIMMVLYIMSKLDLLTTKFFRVITIISLVEFCIIILNMIWPLINNAVVKLKEIND